MRFAGFVLLALVPVLSPADPEDPPAVQCEAAEYRGLDFWIGRWRVVTPNGTFAGNSRVEPALSGCALLEHWKGLYLTTGRVQEGLGVHRFDSATKTWRQAWTDDTGSTSDTVGQREGDRMVYQEVGRSTEARSRVVLAPLSGDRVEQKGERWDEATGTWQTTFHLIYHREH